MQYILNENVFVYDKRGFSGRNIKVFTKWWDGTEGTQYLGFQAKIIPA